MPLSVTEHYIASGAAFTGGVLSVVTHLWLLIDFFPKIRMHRALRPLHIQLSLANLFMVLFFFVSAITHFEQAWIFGPTMCKFYVFWCKFSPIAAVSHLAVCLYGECQHAERPKAVDKANFSPLSLLAWAHGLFWGVGAVTWAKYGQEPAGFTCTVIWYQVQPYVTWMTLVGFAVPTMISAAYAYRMWSRGLLADNHLAKSAVGLMFTVQLQLSGYAVGYVLVVLGVSLNLYAIALASLWTKVMGILHPFVYSNMLAAGPQAKSRQD